MVTMYELCLKQLPFLLNKSSQNKQEWEDKKYWHSSKYALTKLNLRKESFYIDIQIVSSKKIYIEGKIIKKITLV